MAPPGNGIFVVRGEISTLMTAMRRGSKWSSNSYQNDDHDALMKKFHDLKNTLLQVEDLRLVEPNTFLEPFLDVIRSEETTGPVTSLALSSINKFLTYGLIDPTHSTLALAVDNISNAVTHARFVGGDQGSDGVVLLKIIQVLKTLMLSPEGSALPNESVCEIMLSCFRICFETRLNELLRRTAEHALKDIVLLLFMRLPQFADDNLSFNLKTLKMRNTAIDQNKRRKFKSSAGNEKMEKTKTNIPKINAEESVGPISLSEEQPTTPTPASASASLLKPCPLATTPATPLGTIVDMQGSISQTPKPSQMSNTVISSDEMSTEIVSPEESCNSVSGSTDSISIPQIQSQDVENKDYINSMGIRFTPQNDNEQMLPVLVPYGLPCILELFRFLISLCNPLDKQNTDMMTHMGLTLLTVILEVAADSIGKYDSLVSLVKDDLCKNLFSLLNTERLSIFAANLQVCFLLFESLRSHLKFQLEYYLTKLTDIIVNENPRTLYETRELSLDNLLQLWRIPGLASEIYINYDCDLYCSNLFEDLTKILSKNTLSATQSIYSIHVLSMDALLTIIETIEKNCVQSKNGQTAVTTTMRHSRNNSNTERIIIEETEDDENDGGKSVFVENINNIIKSSHINDSRFNHIQPKSSSKISTIMFSSSLNETDLLRIKNKKRILLQGTELFNQRPDKGIQFLQENGILNTTLDALEIAHFLRENSGLDKKMIGEYISKKKNVESKILEVYVKSFDFAGLRIDEALRIYLETFRLPGEAPLIFLVMEHFADHWHKCNNEPFANTDAAFRLAYSIIMLNMDQHNYNAKRLNIPMTCEDFLKNLRGLNGNLDFDPIILTNIYNAIKNEEIVMPAEQTGIVRENYLWKMLLRRGATKDGVYNHIFGNDHDKELFMIVWGPTLAAFSFMFDKSVDHSIHQKAMQGFVKSSAISSYYNLHADFDALILTLCKFTTLVNNQQQQLQVDPNNDIIVNVLFGQNTKAQLAMKTLFHLVHEHGNCQRESWKHVFEIIIQLFKLKLLPKILMETDDFCEPDRKVSLIRDPPQIQKSDVGLFSSLYSYLSSDTQRQATFEEQEIIKISKRCIKDCRIDQTIMESKFLQFDALEELIKSTLSFMKPPENQKSNGVTYPEDVTVFLLEFIIRILIQNRDRLLPLWPICRDQLYLLLLGASTHNYDYLLKRTIIGLLKLAICLMRNEELCPVILQSLKMLLMLKSKLLLSISRQISIGMYELLKTSAQNIHTEADWSIVFSILECVGAGAAYPDSHDTNVGGIKSDVTFSSEDDSGLADRGYISDSEVITKSDNSTPILTPHLSPTSATVNSGDNWIIVNKDAIDMIAPTVQSNTSLRYTIYYPCKLLEHSPFAMVKCWDSLAFIVRNVAHITPFNYECCVKCIRTFVEASIHDGKLDRRTQIHRSSLQNNVNKESSKTNIKRNTNDEGSDSENEEFPERYQSIAIQLLDLMHTLHTRTAQIFRWWAEEGSTIPQCSALWSQGWCPLLQGIARLATDKRRQVRTSALTCLQRALLVHDLQTLTASEWAGCFKQVLFPLLAELLNEEISIHSDANMIEESRIRTSTIMSKVFLHHLTPLISLPNFDELWIEILDYLEKFLKIGSDMLYEAVSESLKNMLLVMHSVKVFHNSNGHTQTFLWDITCKRIEEFAPNLITELFGIPEATSSESKALDTEVKYNSKYVARGNDHIVNNFTRDVNTSNIVHEITLPPPNIIHPQENSVSNYQQHEFLTSSQQQNSIMHQQEQPQSPSICYPQQFETIEKIEPPIESAVVPGLQIPISHLMSNNPYHNLDHNNIPLDIARSFAPIFVQPVKTGEGSDIYSDYVNDPYNLTLNIDVGNDSNNITKTISPNTNIANYFSANSGNIPPGSEMLFGEP